VIRQKTKLILRAKRVSTIRRHQKRYLRVLLSLPVLPAIPANIILQRQAQAIDLLNQNYERGLTWKEFSLITGLHHGTASGVLSVLHKTGRIARLKESRNGCKVYVGLNWVQNRVVEKQGRNKCCPHCGGSL
jgi:hypothetical protein